MTIYDGTKRGEWIDKFPFGTMFICVGSSDGTKYYEVGATYIKLRSHHSFYRLVPLLSKTAVSGNGHSGLWKTITSLENKPLEDYL